jgi:hypothetical protein
MYDGIMKLSNTSKPVSYRTYNVTSVRTSTRNNVQMGSVSFPSSTENCFFGGVAFWSRKSGFRGETQVTARDGSVYLLTPSKE